MDLVHAKDYANMTFNQLRDQLQTSKAKDEAIQKAVQYVNFSLLAEFMMLYLGIGLCKVK